ncbi:MAG: prepilin peptidase [Deltaproteobacteria bacterium]|nr:prepilin peptidase [Deltaproteobacteria bacterium]
MAAAIDWRTRRIPNWLTFPAMILGPVLQLLLHLLLSDWQTALKGGLFFALVGEVVLLVVFLGLNAINAMGMGDVKLAAAVGGFVGWPGALETAVLIFLCGGILALGLAIKGKLVGDVVSHMIHSSDFSSNRTNEDTPNKKGVHIMAYGPAIAAGMVFSAVLRHFNMGLLGL